MHKYFHFILFILYSLPIYSVANSDIRYVTEHLSTYLRKGPSDQFKISGSIQAGEKVKLIEQKERYSLIRDSKNREAWILNTELATTPSIKEQMPMMQQQVQELTLKLTKIDSDWQQRTAEIQRRMEKAEQQSRNLLEQNIQLKKELEISKNKNRDLEIMHDIEQREIIIQWFIYGGMVLGLGVFLGFFMPIFFPRRKKSRGWN